MVVVAHWAVLLEWAEEAGNWFLRGAAGMIMEEVGTRLKDERLEIRGLVEGLQG
jgi:hypothetical protein